MRERDRDEIDVERYELFEGPLYRFEVDRRDFVKSFGAGLLVLLIAPKEVVFGAQQESGRGGGGDRMPADVNAWLHIGEDGTVTVFTGKTEIGHVAPPLHPVRATAMSGVRPPPIAPPSSASRSHRPSSFAWTARRARPTGRAAIAFRCGSIGSGPWWGRGTSCFHGPMGDFYLRARRDCQGRASMTGASPPPRASLWTTARQHELWHHWMRLMML